jgi:cell wall-associated NlpC family hydrolase
VATFGILLPPAVAWAQAEPDCPGTGFKSCAERSKYGAGRGDRDTFTLMTSRAQPFNKDIQCPEFDPTPKPQTRKCGDEYEYSIPREEFRRDTCEARVFAMGAWGVRTGILPGMIERRELETAVPILAAAFEAKSRITAWCKSDEDKVNKLYQACGIKQEITPGQINAAIETFTTHMRNAAKKLAKIDPTAAENMDIPINIIKNLTDESKYFPGILGYEEKSPSPKNLYWRLKSFEVCGSDGGIVFHESQRLSRYQARMIRLFAAENACRAKKSKSEADKIMNELAHDLKLKVNVKDPQDETPKVEVKDPQNASWADIIPHDGYVMGASMLETESLFVSDYIGADVSVGVDCSALVQHALNKAVDGKMWDDKPRMYTAGMVKSPPVDMNVERVCSETQLQPGDVLAFNKNGHGHTYIFAGYSNIAPHNPIIFEATGGAQRDVDFHQVNFYDNDDSCQTSRFTKKATYRFRPKPAQVREAQAAASEAR